MGKRKWRRLWFMSRLEPGSVPGSPRKPLPKLPPHEPRMRPQLCDACHLSWAKHYATNFELVITLVFCGYHFRKHKDALKAKGFVFGEAK